MSRPRSQSDDDQETLAEKRVRIEALEAQIRKNRAKEEEKAKAAKRKRQEEKVKEAENPHRTDVAKEARKKRRENEARAARAKRREDERAAREEQSPSLRTILLTKPDAATLVSASPHCRRRRRHHRHHSFRTDIDLNIDSAPEVTDPAASQPAPGCRRSRNSPPSQLDRESCCVEIPGRVLRKGTALRRQNSDKRSSTDSRPFDSPGSIKPVDSSFHKSSSSSSRRWSPYWRWGSCGGRRPHRRRRHRHHPFLTHSRRSFCATWSTSMRCRHCLINTRTWSVCLIVPFGWAKP